MSPKAWGIFFLASAFAVLGFIAYKNSAKRQVPIVFSPRSELLALWDQYKKEYIEPGTYRTIDRQKNDITTSEGQSYAMLRAVWLDDKETFDKSWQWTKDNLQLDDSKLFAWLFGERSDGTYGIITSEGGHNTATDADVDIAIALIFASSRWNQSVYLDDARAIINDIWKHEVIMINERPYLAANNIEKISEQTVVINPSYFAPYAYRIFAEIDPGHPWMEVVNTSYEVLEQSMKSSLDRSSSANIPPDWVLISRSNGTVVAPNSENLTTNTSFDALRVPWRLYLDWIWYQEPRAEETLRKMSFLSSEWKSKELLYTSYRHDGKAEIRNQSPAFYGGTLGYFMLADPESAKAIYNKKLQSLFNPDSNTWKVRLGYYDDNWAWFGIALYNNMLTNLAKQ